MKQVLVLAVVAFLAAVAGGTWFATSLWPVNAAGTDTLPPPVVLAPARPAPLPGPEAVDASARLEDSAAAAAPAAPPPAANVAVPSPEVIAREKSVAKVIAAMKPRDAAGLAANLSDDEVERIVRQLNPKQVAALLTALPQERAATLSRRLLEPSTSKPGGSE